MRALSIGSAAADMPEAGAARGSIESEALGEKRHLWSW